MAWWWLAGIRDEADAEDVAVLPVGIEQQSCVAVVHHLVGEELPAARDEFDRQVSFDSEQHKPTAGLPGPGAESLAEFRQGIDEFLWRILQLM